MPQAGGLCIVVRRTAGLMCADVSAVERARLRSCHREMKFARPDPFRSTSFSESPFSSGRRSPASLEDQTRAAVGRPQERACIVGVFAQRLRSRVAFSSSRLRHDPQGFGT